MRVAFALAAAVLLSSCATAPGEDRLAQQDPLEKVNRGIWGFNQAVDKVILKPVSSVYRAIAPRPLRQGVTHFFANVGEPFSAVNNLLQGKPDRAARNLKRFIINTTIGVGGLIDQASPMGVQPAPEDFGQTLARWGVNGGPYLVLPILGPSTLRDGVGIGVGQFADPYRVCLRECGLPNGVPTALTLAYVIDTRATLTEAGADAFLDSSADAYATARSAFLQRRRAAILDKDEEANAPGAGGGGAPEDDAIDAAVQDIDDASGSDAGVPADASRPATNNAPAPTGDAPPAPVAAGGTTGDADLDQAVGEMEQEQGASPAPADSGSATPAP